MKPQAIRPQASSRDPAIGRPYGTEEPADAGFAENTHGVVITSIRLVDMSNAQGFEQRYLWRMIASILLTERSMISA